MLAFNYGWKSTAAPPPPAPPPTLLRPRLAPDTLVLRGRKTQGAREPPCGAEAEGKGSNISPAEAEGQEGSKAWAALMRKGQNQPVLAEEDSASPVVAEKPIAQHEPSPLIPFDVIGPFEKPAFPSRPGS